MFCLKIEREISCYCSDIQVIFTIVPTMHILTAYGCSSYSTNTFLPSSSFMLSNIFRLVGSNFLPLSRTRTHEQPSSPVKFLRVADTLCGHGFSFDVFSSVFIGLLHEIIMQQTINNIVVNLNALIPFSHFLICLVVLFE